MELASAGPDASSADECLICLEPLTPDNTQWLACAHKYHRKCIEDWLRKNSECPVCRIPVSPRDRPRAEAEQPRPREASVSAAHQGVFVDMRGAPWAHPAQEAPAAPVEPQWQEDGGGVFAGRAEDHPLRRRRLRQQQNKRWRKWGCMYLLLFVAGWALLVSALWRTGLSLYGGAGCGDDGARLDPASECCSLDSSSFSGITNATQPCVDLLGTFGLSGNSAMQCWPRFGSTADFVALWGLTGLFACLFTLTLLCGWGVTLCDKEWWLPASKSVACCYASPEWHRTRSCVASTWVFCIALGLALLAALLRQTTMDWQDAAQNTALSTTLCSSVLANHACLPQFTEARQSVLCSTDRPISLLTFAAGAFALYALLLCIPPARCPGQEDEEDVGGAAPRRARVLELEGGEGH